MAVIFIEPGGDATQSVANPGLFSAVVGTVAYATDQAYTGAGSIKCTSDVVANAYFNKAGVMADTGRRVSFHFRFDTLPDADLKLTPLEIDQAGGATCFGLTIRTTGKLAIYDKNNVVQATGNTVLAVNTWYRISVVYNITSGSVNSISVYLNGTPEVTASNITVNTASNYIYFGGQIETVAGANTWHTWTDNIYIDDGTSGDPGNICVTAKRPVANGTLNDWVTQIGSGGSGYGAGHSPQVNERPTSTTNGWSIQSASLKVEEYSIEGKAVGDADISNAQILDFMGWVYAKVGVSNTGNIVVAGAATNISLTTSYFIYTQIAGTSTYPTGGNDIGMDNNSVNQLFSLAECGIVVAYIPSVSTPALVSTVPSYSFGYKDQVTAY